MHGIKSTIDKFGYEYTNLKTIGRGTYGVVWLCERDGRLQPNPFFNRFYNPELHKVKYCAIKVYT